MLESMAGHPLERGTLAELCARGVTPEHRLGVGCSGGPDSAALAHIAMSLSRRGALGPIVLVHIDHQLRPGSQRDADVVRHLAERGGGEVKVVRVDVDRTGGSLERAARDARYRGFETAFRELELDWMLLAHTASDQAETVLMRILRGTGITGLSAIPPVRARYLRPLLAVPRAEIAAYVTQHDVATLHDPMNDDEAFLRTRVRTRWLPALRRENPALDRALCQLAESAAEQREVLDFAAQHLLELAGFPLDVATLARSPEAVLRRALAVAAEEAGGEPLEARHQKALAELVRRPRAGTRSLDLSGVRAVREYDVLRFEPSRPSELSGQSTWPDGQNTCDSVIVSGPDPPYQVRTWQPGDRMRPARLNGRSRKLSDLFTDAKIPRRLRPRAVVVVRTRDGVIEWAEHIGPAYDSDVSVSLTQRDPVASNNILD